jgi:uncharacterized protein YkwD
MVRTSAIACAVAALLVGGTGVATASAKSKAGTCAGQYVIPVDDATRQRASTAVLCLVNRARTAQGLGPVRPAAQLDSAAAGHSADMVANKYLSHTSPNGDGAIQRVQRTGYNWLAVGEAIDWGAGRDATAFKLVAGLLRSPEHRPILLDRHYREIGVGLALGAPTPKAAGSASTLTLDFGSR